MSEHELPTPGTVVELTADDGAIGGVRVVPADDDAPAGALTLSMAPARVPAAGAAVTLRWPAGMRGRHAVQATVEEVAEGRVRVRTAGPVQIEQHRNFVRGGGGEQVMLHRPGCADTFGWVRDISEQGVRAHFADVVLEVGDEIRLRVQLDEHVIEVAAAIARVGSLRQSVPRPGPLSVEVVAAISPDEHQAQVIRRYIFRQQLLSRSRTTG